MSASFVFSFGALQNFDITYRPLWFSFSVHFQMIKFIQSNKFINNDLHMYHAESNTPAQARTSNLNEELGQVNV